MAVTNIDQDTKRNEQIYTLRIVHGNTWRDIGQTVGMTHVGARKAFYKFIGEGITEDERNQYRAEETAKIDQIEAAYQHAAELAAAAGKLPQVFDALDGRLKCIKQRTTINGLAASQKVEINVTREDLFAKWDAYLEGAATANVEA